MIKFNAAPAFDFDEWATLYQRDPEAFEARRKAMLAIEIAKGGVHAEAGKQLVEKLEAQLAELKALDAQHARLERHGIALNTERVALSLASYEAGRADLSTVLMARREAVEARLRLIDLDAQRAALRVRLNTLVAE